MTEQSYSLFVTSACVIIIIFTVHMLVLRLKQQQAYLPLVLFFSGLGIILSKPLFAILAPGLHLPILVFSLPALLVIPPSFWCYVEGLTHTTKWQFDRRHLKHFLLPLFGLFISISTLLLPTDLVRAVLTDGGEHALNNSNVVLRYFVYGLLISTFALILAWVIQSGFYVYTVFKRLATYRQQLKQVFASTESKEFYWISWLLAAIGSTWLLLAVYLVLDNLYTTFAFSFEPFKFLLLVMIWSIAIWALRHKPGFEEIYGDDGEPITFEVNNESQVKYQKSALSEEQASKIASKVNNFMKEQEAYLDPTISLQKLAKNINTTPNYLSQTLNEKLNMSFFDYVNKHRIEAASEQLKNSKTSVIDIAMDVGFNSKSSFYTAFKKATQMTPSEFRKQYPNNEG